MFKDLLVNVSLLITTLFIGSQVFKNRAIGEFGQFKDKILVGILGGLSGITLMYYGFNINSEVFLDFGNILAGIVVLMGGSVSIFITTILRISFQLLYFGISTYSIDTLIGMIIVALGYVLISTFKISQVKKCIYMGIESLIIRTIVFSLLIKDISILVKILVIFWIGTVVIGFVAYYLIKYLITTHKLMFQLRKNAIMDFLTGLNNKRGFDIHFNSIIKSSLKKGEKLSFLMLDIDFFKKVNDTYGHLSGDLVLNQLAQIIISSCRIVDVVSRIGGEEFSILLPDCSLSETIEIAERIRINVENNDFIIENQEIIHITISIGLACIC